VFSTPLIGRIISFFARGSDTMVEQWTTDPEIAGSIPAATWHQGTMFKNFLRP
jgi:hypothetical protein